MLPQSFQEIISNKNMPFAGYKNFADCVRQNRSKKDPQAYCGSIMHQVEDKEEDFNVTIDTKIPVYGLTDFRNEEIKINPKAGDVVNTIIHEKLHANYPNMPHDEVYANAAKIESKMTLPDMAKELLEVDQRSKYPKYKREIVYTEASKVIESNIK